MEGHNKRLYRYPDKGIFGGIIAGLGEYLNMDAVFIRLIWVVLVAVTGFIPGIIAYLLAFFIVPRAPGVAPISQERQEHL